MRLAIAMLLVMTGLPAAQAASAQKACQNSCAARYNFCLKASTTKQARKTCKATRKACKKGCVATTIQG